MILLAASLFFTHPAPLDMPRAEAYMVTEGERRRLEDRFSELDLWTSQAVLGRWEDDDGRMFTVARLEFVPPKFTSAGMTRAKYAQGAAKFDAKEDFGVRDEAVALLSPVEIAAEPESPHQRIRGHREVLYYEGTNETAVVCAFLPENDGVWRMAAWELAENDDHAWARELFEREILEKWDDVVRDNLRSEIPADAKEKRKKAKRAARKAEERAAAAEERELLRKDARHSVTNYTAWHVTDAEEFSILDNLPDAMRFIDALTNDLTKMRRRYSEVLPSPLDGSNVLCVARIYANRDDYLAAASEGMEWTAAYWNPLRRELVAHLPEGGTDELLRTIRHEAFHQYLSYAGCMLSAAPWLNEGYAQYFEDEDSTDWKLGHIDSTLISEYADMLPSILACDYEEFYDGDQAQKRLKYRLAWSIAVFLEKGAPKVRFQPFATIKSDYMSALLKTRDMARATAAAFPTKEKIDLFIREWKSFWINM